MTKNEQIALCFGSPPLSWFACQPSIIEVLVGEISLKEYQKNLKEQKKYYKQYINNLKKRCYERI